jgi:hypothetical protein
MQKGAKQLNGKWKSDPGDTATQASYGEISMTFHEDGRLIYVVQGRDKDEVLRLVYKASNDELVTDQPSTPTEHRTKFSFDERGRLILEDGGERSRFVRVK